MVNIPSDCPCALLMVNAKANVKNWVRSSANGNIDLEGESFIRGIKTLSPRLAPVSTKHSMVLFSSEITRRRVPLMSPLAVFKFLISNTIAPTLRTNKCLGRPETSKLIRNS
jgi:hypothetical protein